MRKEREGEREEHAKFPLSSIPSGTFCLFQISINSFQFENFQTESVSQELDSRAPHAQERILFVVYMPLGLLLIQCNLSTHTYFFKIESLFFLSYQHEFKTF